MPDISIRGRRAIYRAFIVGTGTRYNWVTEQAQPRKSDVRHVLGV